MAFPFGAVGSVLGGLISSAGQRVANERSSDAANNALHKQDIYAQHGVTIRARDVMKAYGETGLHPLALLGVNPSMPSAVSTNFGNEAQGLGEGIARAGQDINSSMYRTADRDMRRKALDLQEVQLKNNAVRGSLENELLLVRIQSERQRLRQIESPGIHFGPGSGSFVKTKPHEVTATAPGRVGLEPGVMPDSGVVTTPYGTKVIVPSRDFKDRAEDMLGLGPTWFARNYIAPLFSRSIRDTVRSKVLGDPGKGRRWVYQPLTGDWDNRPVYVERKFDRTLPVLQGRGRRVNPWR